MSRQYAALVKLDTHPPRTGLAYVAVRAIVYVLALVAFVLIFGTKERGLLMAPPVALLSAVGTWYVLGDTPVDGQRRLMLAGAVGLLMAQLTWAFGYWNVAALVGGAGLWLGFYVLSGIAEHGANRSLDRRIASEYGLVALIGGLVILLVARPWSA
ncbi:MAG TPA: hypothetical protein VGQ62_03580 [Chloroflexota bacterium]|nr:hypothetical protein [Chloroflexota bacterium]